MITANDVNVLSGTIQMPLVGVWSADLVIDQHDGTGFDAGTKVTIKAGDITLTGTVAADRSGDFLDAVHVRILGGAGGMAKSASKAAYVQPSAFVRDVLNGLAGDSGETLSNTIDQTFLTTNLTAWAVMTGLVSEALLPLINLVAPGANWRILADGTLWIGTESWPTSNASYELIESNPADGSSLLGVDGPSITPGVNLTGIGNISRVEHQIAADKIRTRVWNALTDPDRGMALAVMALAQHAVAGIDYFTLYDAKVITQSADMATVDIQPQDQRLPGMQRVSLRLGCPGVQAQVTPGAIVRLGWDRGNPQYPYACLFNTDASAIKIVIKGTTVVINDGVLGVARQTDQVTGTAGPYPLSNAVIAGGSATVTCG